MTNEAGLEFENDGQSLAEVFHPSVFIRDELAERGWSFDLLIRSAKATPEEIVSLGDVVYDGAAVTEATSHTLSRAFGTTQGLWLGLQRAYDYWVQTTKGGAQ